jgi:hypothetical protein
MRFSGQFLPSERASVARKKTAARPPLRTSAIGRTRSLAPLARGFDRKGYDAPKNENFGKKPCQVFLAGNSIFLRAEDRAE